MAVDSHGDVYVGEVSWTEFGKNMDPPREVRSVQKLVKQRYGEFAGGLGKVRFSPAYTAPSGPTRPHL